MPINPKDSYQSDVDDNHKRMKEIEVANPDTYFNDKEWRKLNERNRMLNINIERIERMEKLGARF